MMKIVLFSLRLSVSMSIVSHAATVVAILGSVGIPVVLAAHGKKTNAMNHNEKSSYAPLLAEGEEAIPTRYQDF